MKRIIAAVISISLLTLLIWKVDTATLVQNFRTTRWGIFSIAITLFIPQILTIAWRWKRLVKPFTPLALGESVKMVLAGATMNLVLPGKMGDLTKGWFLAKAGAVSLPLGLGVVVFEKMLDVAALGAFMLLGVLLILVSNSSAFTIPLPSLILALGIGLAAVGTVTILYFVPLENLPGMNMLAHAAETDKRFAKLDRMVTGSHTTMNALRARGSNRPEIITLSFLIWTLHLTQIYLFFLSLNAAPSPAQFFSMVPLAIFIGLLPISIAGFGTRDAALVALLPGIPSSLVVAAALYINLRYIIPAIGGIPYVGRFALERQRRT